jgi:hypothetical protein
VHHLAKKSSKGRQAWDKATKLVIVFSSFDGLQTTTRRQSSSSFVFFCWVVEDNNELGWLVVVFFFGYVEAKDANESVGLIIIFVFVEQVGDTCQFSN